jgi:hypothetical protein
MQACKLIRLHTHRLELWSCGGGGAFSSLPVLILNIRKNSRQQYPGFFVFLLNCWFFRYREISYFILFAVEAAYVFSPLLT